MNAKLAVIVLVLFSQVGSAEITLELIQNNISVFQHRYNALSLRNFLNGMQVLFKARVLDPLDDPKVSQSLAYEFANEFQQTLDGFHRTQEGARFKSALEQDGEDSEENQTIYYDIFDHLDEALIVAAPDFEAHTRHVFDFLTRWKSSINNEEDKKDMLRVVQLLHSGWANRLNVPMNLEGLLLNIAKHRAACSDILRKGTS